MELASLKDQRVYLSTKVGGTKPFRIVVIQAGAIVGEFPKFKSCSLKVFNQETLHRGRHLLFINEASSASPLKVAALDLEALRVAPNYWSPLMSMESYVLGVSVDPTGRYTPLATQWDDFPEWVVHDAEAHEFIQLDCKDLIDAPICDVRWRAAPARVTAKHAFNDEDFEFPSTSNSAGRFGNANSTLAEKRPTHLSDRSAAYSCQCLSMTPGVAGEAPTK
jgi:hypothetical protein